MKRFSLSTLTPLTFLFAGSAFAGENVFQDVTRKIVGESPNEWITFLGEVHPLVVHMPIGFIIGAFLLDFFGLFRKSLDQLGYASSMLLGFAALTSWVGLFLGFFYSLEHGSGDDLYWHTVGGIIFTVLVTLVWILKRRRNKAEDSKGRFMYSTLLLIALGILSWTGHLGGVMVHGEMSYPEPVKNVMDKGNAVIGDLFGTDKKPAEEDPEPSTDPEGTNAVPKTSESNSVEKVAEKPAGTTEVSFSKDIQPIFEAHCNACHGADKAKGKLRMHTKEELLKHEDLIVAGSPDDSDLVYCLTAEDEDELMPPPDDEDSKPLSKDQIELITKWVEQGATFD